MLNLLLFFSSFGFYPTNPPPSDRARDFIYNAINQGGQVLVHCNGGISLSPAFVVMFVMQHYRLSCEDALHMVQNRRYCISPNGGFLLQIKVCVSLSLSIPTDTVYRAPFFSL